MTVADPIASLTFAGVRSARPKRPLGLTTVGPAPLSQEDVDSFTTRLFDRGVTPTLIWEAVGVALQVEGHDFPLAAVDEEGDLELRWTRGLRTLTITLGTDASAYLWAAGPDRQISLEGSFSTRAVFGDRLFEQAKQWLSATSPA